VDIGDNFDQESFPYKLCLEQKNILPNLCCYCNQSHVGKNCRLPYDQILKVSDLLKQVKSNNNTSLYGNEKGKNDLQLNLVWHKDFEFTFYKHLSQFEGQAKTVENV
jgi:hypothetical protein